MCTLKSVLSTLAFLAIFSFIQSQETKSACTRDKIWKIFPDDDINHFYLECKNAYIVYNKKNDYYQCIYGDSKTASLINNKNGFGYIMNFDTFLAHIPMDGLKSFDVSEVDNGDYKNLTAIYEYGAQYIPYITGVNASNPYLANTTSICTDLSKSPNVASWPSFAGLKMIVDVIKSKFLELVDGMYKIYSTTDYTIEQGHSIHSIFVADYYGTTDARRRLLAEFPAYLTKERSALINKELVIEFHRLIKNEDVNVARQKFEKLKNAVKSVGTTYDSISSAIDATKNMI